MGYIYALIVDEYDGVYIGKTVKTIKERFSEHLREAKKGISKSKLNEAIRNTQNNIQVIEIEQCDNSILHKREAYYIKLFNTVENGLNSLYGTPVSYNDRTIVTNIIADFVAGKPMIYLANKYKITYSYISKLMTRAGVSRNYIEQGEKTNKHKPVVVYTCAFEAIGKFESIKAAINWLNSSGYNIQNYNGYTRISQSCLIGNIAYGYRWQFLENLIYENKEFNTIFDIEAYKNGGDLVKNKHGLYESTNKTVSDARKPQSEQAKCIKCGKIINYNTKYCRDCYNKLDGMQRSGYVDRQVPEGVSFKHPLSEDELRELYPKYTLNSIARACGVSYTTMNKLAKKYGIK